MHNVTKAWHACKKLHIYTTVLPMSYIVNVSLNWSQYCFGSVSHTFFSGFFLIFILPTERSNRLLTSSVYFIKWCVNFKISLRRKKFHLKSCFFQVSIKNGLEVSKSSLHCLVSYLRMFKNGKY